MIVGKFVQTDDPLKDTEERVGRCFTQLRYCACTQEYCFLES